MTTYITLFVMLRYTNRIIILYLCIKRRTERLQIRSNCLCRLERKDHTAMDRGQNNNRSPSNSSRIIIMKNPQTFCFIAVVHVATKEILKRIRYLKHKYCKKKKSNYSKYLRVPQKLFRYIYHSRILHKVGLWSSARVIQK